MEVRGKRGKGGKCKEKRKREEKVALLFHLHKKIYHLKELSFHILSRRLWVMLALFEQPLVTTKYVCSRNQKNVDSEIQFSKQNNVTSFIIQLQDTFLSTGRKNFHLNI